MTTFNIATKCNKHIKPNTQILQKSIYLYLLSDCFMKISLQRRNKSRSRSRSRFVLTIVEKSVYETVCEQIQIN